MTQPDFSGYEPEKDRPIDDALSLMSKFAWIGTINQLGGIATSLWLIYIVAVNYGFLASVFSFAGLSVCIYPLGLAPLFAFSASILCFYFEKVGFWLPLLSYITSAIGLYVSLKIDRASRIGTL